MGETIRSRRKLLIVVAAVAPLMLASLSGWTQAGTQAGSQTATQTGTKHRPLESQAESTDRPRRTRLILKDGSFQIVTGYRIVGDTVHYTSAERGGAEEVVPLALVDLAATKKWEQRHDPDAPPETTIDPELLKEEADRAALTPEVAPDLSLPLEDSVLALDVFHGTPELVPMPQAAGDLNRNTAHNLQHLMPKFGAAPHTVVELRGESAGVQLHVSDPEFFVRLGDDSFAPTGGGAPLTVDTHGATGNAPTAPTGGSAASRYVIVRTDVRVGARLIRSFDPDPEARGDDDVTATRAQPLPGGHWLKLTPVSPLLFGEYALVEVLPDRALNTDVWDFGVHPVAPDNRDAIKPEAKRPIGLSRRRPN